MAIVLAAALPAAMLAGALPSGRAASTTPSPASSDPGSTPGISLELRCATNVFKVGDVIPVDFVFTSHLTNNYYNAEHEDADGRLDQYKLIARSSSGEIVPDPRRNVTNSEEAARRVMRGDILHPGESFTRNVLLNRWALIQEPGQYEITGISSFFISPSIHAKSDPITITVLPRSKEEMADYIKGLTNQVAERLAKEAGKSAKAYDPVLHECMMKLMFTGSPEIVPSLFKILEESSHEGHSFYEALAYCVPPAKEIRQALITESARLDREADPTNWLRSSGIGERTNQDNANAYTRNWLRFTIRNYPLTNEAPAAAADPVGGTSGITLEVRCTNDVSKAGDEIPIEFFVSNLGTSDYKYANRTYDRSGRMDEYQLFARQADGSVIADPRRNLQGFMMGGGLYQEAVLHPGESFSKIIPLNRWALLSEAGQYEVLATYFGGGNVGGQLQVRAAPLGLTVRPRTAQEMDDYIRGLTNQVMAELAKPRPTNGPPNQDLTDLVMKLMYTCSPAIVPALLQIELDDGPEILKDGSTRSRGNEDFYVNEALLYYVHHSESVGDAIVAAAARNGSIGNLEGLLRGCDFDKKKLKPLIERALAAENDDLGEWRNGANLAARTYYDDSFLLPLIGIAGNTKATANCRGAAITALANNRTDPGVFAIKSVLDDPDPKLWTPLAIAILNGLGNAAPNPMGRHLLPGDFTTAEVRPLLERMLGSTDVSDKIFGTSLAEQYGSDALTPKLVVLAKGRDRAAKDSAIYALALNRTEEGIKTLKALLNDPDPQVSKTAEDAIRHAYTDRGDAQGKPLLPGDFETKYGSPEVKPDPNDMR